MPDPAAWQAFGGVLLVLILLGGAVVALRRLGLVRPPPAPAAAPAAPDANCNSVQDNLIERVHTLERELDALKLRIAENYVRRDDHITSQSRVIGMLETHSAMLARLEERIGALRNDG